MIFFQPNYIAHAPSWYDSKTLDDSTLLTRIVGKRINLIDMDREHFKLELAISVARDGPSRQRQEKLEILRFHRRNETCSITTACTLELRI